VNHPQRRLAALAILVREWSAFRRASGKGTAGAVEKFFDGFHGQDARTWLLKIVRNTFISGRAQDGRGTVLPMSALAARFGFALDPDARCDQLTVAERQQLEILRLLWLGVRVLILDEVGFVPFTKTGADLLFSFLSALHEQVSLIVTTTVPFPEWAALFGGDQRLTAALLDRLTFHAHVLQFSGSSYRLRQSLKRQEEERRQR